MNTQLRTTGGTTPADIWRMDHDHVLHPWTHHDSFREQGSLIVSSASGAHITDINGKRYLDGIGGMWCVNIGYGREELVQAMADQARRLAYSNSLACTRPCG